MKTVMRHYRVRSGEVRDVAAHAVVEGEGQVRATADVDGSAAAWQATSAARSGAAVVVSLAPSSGASAAGAEASRRRAIVVRDGDTVHVHVSGRTWRLTSVVPRPGGAADAHGADDPFAASPMTGVVRKVLVRPGDRVAAGAALFVVEAMKMEFSVVAPRDVVVAEVRSAEGDRVDIQQVVVTFAAGAAEAKP